jgi:hypothetical protein
MWKDLPDEEKQRYKDQYKDNLAAYRENHPGKWDSGRKKRGKKA